MSLAGKVALITGGTKGIGFAGALKLRSLGATVVINYNSDKKAAEEAVDKLGGPENALAIQADASNVSSLKSLVDEVVGKYGKIDILINNAGILPLGSITSATEDVFDKAININVKGPFFLTQFAAPHIPSGGRVIFISSSLTIATGIIPHYAVYVTSKGAVEQLARTTAKELGAKGISVNIVSPGPVETALFTGANNEQSTGMVKALTPSHRLGQPEDIAEVFAFLASPESAWINGQNIRVNGGFAV